MVNDLISVQTYNKLLTPKTEITQNKVGIGSAITPIWGILGVF